MIRYLEKELRIIWLDSFVGLEYKHKLEIYNFIKDAKRTGQGLVDAKEYIINSVGQNEYTTMENSLNQVYLDYILEELDRKGIRAITFESKDYPQALLEIPLPPLVLYTKGNIELLNGEIFGIVGSRKSIPLSITIAEDYSKTLLNAGLTLITGIAEGVDSAVLKSGVENKGKIISVVAGGFDNLYPKSNLDLFNKVADCGLVISEQPPRVSPKPYLFPIRNRIIAALSKGVLIVSGAIKSGTLYTAEYAEEYGKDLFAVPYSVGINSGEGCNDLIKRGAILTDTPQDILDYYDLTNNDTSIVLSQDEKAVCKILSNGQMHIEQISSALKKRTFEITPILSQLEMKKMIVKSANTYSLVHSYSEE